MSDDERFARDTIVHLHELTEREPEVFPNDIRETIEGAFLKITEDC